MISNHAAKNSVLAAAFATSALVGGALQASASVVDTFSVNPNPITVGGQSTIDLQLNLLSDFACNTSTCQGYYNAQFTGGTATIFNGIGDSQLFNIGSGGTSRDFQLQSTYLNAGTWNPNFTISANYTENYELYQYEYTDWYNCGFFGCTSYRDVYGWITYSTTGNNTSGGGSTSLTVDPNFSISSVSATPLPAALPLFATGLGAFGLLGWRRKRKFNLAPAS
jgi:hypothetical protein